MTPVDHEDVVQAKSTLASTSNTVAQTSVSHAQRAVDSSNAEAIEGLCMDKPAFPTTGESDGTIDIESLCLSQDFKSMTEVQKVVTNVPFCRPDREWFFRVHPEFGRYMAVLSEKKENYVVTPKMFAELGGEAMKKMVVLGQTRQGVFFFWPLKIEAERGLDEWSESALVVMETAKTKWTKMKSNQDVKCYEAFTAKGNFGEPTWPETETEIEALLTVALRNRIISTTDHLVIKRRNGEL